MQRQLVSYYVPPKHHVNVLISCLLCYENVIGLSANETDGEETGEIVEPAIPEEDDDVDRADGRGTLTLLLMPPNSLGGGGLLTICTSGVQNVVNFCDFEFEADEVAVLDE